MVVAWAAVAVWVGWQGNQHPLWMFAMVETIGICFAGAGLWAWWRLPHNRLGLLMVVCGAGWYLHDIQASHNAVLYGIGYWLYFLPAFLFVHLALAFPHGHLARRVERWTVAGGYAAYLVLEGVRYLREGSRGPVGWQAGPNPTSLLGNVLSVVGIGLAVTTGTLVIGRWRSASRPARRAFGLAWLGMLIAIAAAAIAVVFAILANAPDSIAANIQFGVLLFFGAALFVVLFALAIRRLPAMLARLRVTDLVRSLERAVDPARLGDLLATALDDPSLTVGYWSEEAGGYLGVDGRPLDLPVGDPARTVTPVEQDGRRLAVLLHDAAATEDRPLVEAVVAAARLALENARLHAEERLHQARLVEVAVAERRKIERNLHDSVQGRLLALIGDVK